MNIINTCVCCGDEIPEGRQICWQCENSDKFNEVNNLSETDRGDGGFGSTEK